MEVNTDVYEAMGRVFSCHPDNLVAFDPILKDKIKSFSDGKYEIQDAKSIYYKNKDDFMAYLTFRCIDKRTTWEMPNLENLHSDEFSFESWKEAA